MRDIRIARLHARTREERLSQGVSFPDFCVSADACRVAAGELAARLDRDGLLGVSNVLSVESARRLERFVLDTHYPAVRQSLEAGGSTQSDWLGDVHYCEDSKGDQLRWDLKLP